MDRWTDRQTDRLIVKEKEFNFQNQDMEQFEQNFF